MTEQETTCVIVCGGPAGIMAGLLLARGGVQVTVLEKHVDFLRDFRGDTVYSSTLQLLDEMGLYEQFTNLPQLTKFEKVSFDLPDGRRVTTADFTKLRLPHRYLALAPRRTQRADVHLAYAPRCDRTTARRDRPDRGCALQQARHRRLSPHATKMGTRPMTSLLRVR